MPESQNVEYKQSWHNDYLKWVCGFANADGGKIYIGMRNVGNNGNQKGNELFISNYPTAESKITNYERSLFDGYEEILPRTQHIHNGV